VFLQYELCYFMVNNIACFVFWSRRWMCTTLSAGTIWSLWTHYNKHRRVKEYLLRYTAAPQDWHTYIKKFKHFKYFNIVTFPQSISILHLIHPRYMYIHIQVIFYTLTLTYLLRKLRQASVLSYDLFSLIWIHISNLQWLLCSCIKTAWWWSLCDRNM
jgi:hypothetical protein